LKNIKLFLVSHKATLEFLRLFPRTFKEMKLKTVTTNILWTDTGIQSAEYSKSIITEGMYIGYWWESQKERDHWEDQDVGEVENVKMDLREIGWDGRDRIELAQDRDQWRALVNTVMNLRVP
jgi:hypothetical protein